MKNRINDDMISAMKAKDKELLSVLRMVKSQIQLEEINNKKELTDDEVISVVSKQIKMRKDSIEEFKKGNRDDLIEKVQSEINLLVNYLPEQLSTEELTKIIDEIILKTESKTSSDLGKIMKELLPIIKGKADMKEVNEIIKSKLN